MARVRHPDSSVGYALIFPNRRDVGMANLGLDALYCILKNQKGAEADFHFADRPLGLLTSKKASGGDVIAFSLSFEGDYPAVVDFLLSEKIPPLSADRDEKHPLVIAGGIAATLNPEPLAPFIDVFYLGEAESSFGAFHDFIRENLGSRRAGFLRKLAIENIPGVYVPSACDPDGLKERVG
ncbi:radical SAM protein, partial [bacterium]